MTKILHDGTEVSDETPTKVVGSNRHLLTEEEIILRETEVAEYEKNKPYIEWEKEIKETDNYLPRYVEDIIDALDTPIKMRISNITMEKYNIKKQIRARKPE